MNVKLAVDIAALAPTPGILKLLGASLLTTTLSQFSAVGIRDAVVTTSITGAGGWGGRISLTWEGLQGHRYSTLLQSLTADALALCKLSRSITKS